MVGQQADVWTGGMGSKDSLSILGLRPSANRKTTASVSNYVLRGVSVLISPPVSVLLLLAVRTLSASTSTAMTAVDTAVALTFAAPSISLTPIFVPVLVEEGVTPVLGLVAPHAAILRGGRRIGLNVVWEALVEVVFARSLIACRGH